MYNMIVEQTSKYKKRICYDPLTNEFHELEFDSLMYRRNYKMPYGWIKESGTPPNAHWDVLLVTDDEHEPGDEIPIRIIGVFLRNDGDHKLVAVKKDSKITDFEQITEKEKNELYKLYPRISNGEGWFGRVIAIDTMKNCDIMSR